MFNLTQQPTETVWEVHLTPTPQNDVAVRARLLEQVRANLEKQLRTTPRSQDFRWQTPLYAIQVRKQSGEYTPGTQIKLVCAPGSSEIVRSRTAKGEGSGNGPASLPSLTLPAPEAARLRERLVGLEAIAADVLLQFRCRWDGQVSRWSAQTGTSLPPGLQAYLSQSCPLFVFEGDPGVGKSALATVLADRYCREQERPGTLLRVTTQVRGGGLVGEFGTHLRQAFATLAALPADELGVLVLDEADALAMRRSEAHAHQEDRAGTATLLQCLDDLNGQPYRAVIMTTNLLSTVDAAIQRRGIIYRFERPGPEARRALLSFWLPQFTPREQERLVKAAHGLTPADMERTLGQAYLRALGQNKAIHPEMVRDVLRRAERTRSV